MVRPVFFLVACSFVAAILSSPIEQDPFESLPVRSYPEQDELNIHEQDELNIHEQDELNIHEQDELNIHDQDELNSHEQEEYQETIEDMLIDAAVDYFKHMEQDDDVRQALELAYQVKNITHTPAALSNCDFKCSTGKPVPKPGYKPVANGCGPKGNMDIKSCGYLTECCNRHDKCYGTCGSGRANCDNRFGTCNSIPLGVKPILRPFCRFVGRLYTLGVRIGGCNFYRGSQTKGCVCQ